MEEDGISLIKEGEQENIGNKKKRLFEKTARERTPETFEDKQPGKGPEYL